MSNGMITEAMLRALRAEIATVLGEYRMRHTLGVEEMAATLARLYAPDEENMLRAAALLHDMTKELTEQQQLEILARHGVTLREDERCAPPIWHGMTAALVIPERYPALATPALLSAVRWHTTGRADMTLTDAILCLADYIEQGRDFPDCVALREAFFAPHPAEMAEKERLAHLRRTLIRYFENTLSGLQKKGRPICPDTLAALESLRNRSEF